MTDIVLYHNPRCSKSRQAQEMLDERGVHYHARLYLKDPLNAAELQQLIARLGIDAARLLRSKEAEYAAAGLHADSDGSTAIQAMLDCPKLMERPILVTPKGARIGRPPEAILDIL